MDPKKAQTGVEIVRLDGGIERRNIVPQRLSATLGTSKSEGGERIAELTWYTGAAVRRESPFGGSFELEFSMDPKHVRLERLNSGTTPVLDSHNDKTLAGVIGVIERASIKSGVGKAIARFSRTEDVDLTWRKIQDGIIRNASMGVAIYRMEELSDSKKNDIQRFRATDWEPLEVSMLPVGADPGAGIRAGLFEEDNLKLGAEAPKKENQNMSQESVDTAGQGAGVVKTAEEIRKIALAMKVPEEFTAGLIAAGSTLEAARNAILNRMAEDGEKQPPTASHHVMLTRDAHDGLVERMTEALTCKLTGKAPSDGAREWMGAGPTDMAYELLRMRGTHVDRWNKAKIIELSMQNSADFTNLLTGTGNRTLLASYQAAESPIKRVCRPAVAPDFRAHQLIRLSESPKFLPVAEGAQITIGPFTESKESCTLATHGRGFSLTRHALINDDLGAFNSATVQFGQAAAALEAQVIVDMLTSAAGVGPTLETDSKALFHTDHNNLAGSGAAMDETTLGTGRTSMRLQKGLDGISIIQAPPAFLVSPATKETIAQKLLATIQATQTSNVNVFGGGVLELLVEPRLDGKSTTRWYLFANPAVAPVLEMLHLEGAEGPQFIRKDNEQGILGIQFYAFIDFAANAIGFRGSWMNPGA